MRVLTVRVSTVFAAWLYGLTHHNRHWLERDPTYRESDNTVEVPVSAIDYWGSRCAS